MAWSSIVSGNSSQTETPPLTLPPLPPRSVESLPSRLHPQRSVAVAVIDANALISSPTSTLFGIADRFVTLKEVLDEVRDPTSRFQLAALPFDVECLQPCEEALRKVTQFSRETGDLQSLSAIDLKLLALSYMLEEQYHGVAHLRTKAPPLKVLQTKHIRERDLPGWGSNVQNIEEWEELSRHADHDDNEESHILKLKNLSLDDMSAEKNLKHIDGQDIHMSMDEGENKDSHMGLQNQNPLESIDSSTMENNLRFEERKQEEFVEEASDEGQWQRAVSRSTRRKHDKRARRRNILLSQSVKVVESTQSTQGFKHDPTVALSENEGNNHQDNERSKADVIGDDRGTETCLGLEDRTYEAEVHHQGSINGNCEDLVLKETKNATNAEVEEEKTMECRSLTAEEANSEGTDDIDVEIESDEVNDRCSLINELNCGEEASSMCGTESEESLVLHPLFNSSVACITADFAMQNVLLQIGLRVISPNGLQIHKLHRWVLKCEACRNVVSDVGRLFCPKCGNGGTLYKVSVSVGPNGVTHTGRRRRTNIQGTKYSLPLPKGGRHGTMENPILREDQLAKKLLQPKKKKVSVPEFSTFSDIFEVKTVGKQSLQPPIREALAVFSGKRNPNACRKQRR